MSVVVHTNRNYNQWTPLDLAAAKGWTKTCHVLLSNDAPIDPVDKNKVSSFHMPVCKIKKIHREIYIIHPMHRFIIKKFATLFSSGYNSVYNINN